MTHTNYTLQCTEQRAAYALPFPLRIHVFSFYLLFHKMQYTVWCICGIRTSVRHALNSCHFNSYYFRIHYNRLLCNNYTWGFYTCVYIMKKIPRGNTSLRRVNTSATCCPPPGEPESPAKRAGGEIPVIVPSCPRALYNGSHVLYSGSHVIYSRPHVLYSRPHALYNKNH